MVRDAARRDPSADAVVDGARRVGYAELLERVEHAARSLMASGIAPGERVAVWAPNSIEWIVAALGITMSGGVLVPVNTRFKGTEAAYVLARSGARALFTVRGFLDTDYPALLAAADIALPALDHIIILSGDAEGAISLSDFTARASTVSSGELDARADVLGPDAPADVVFTSGTTGNPKGVVMAHSQTLRAYLDW